MEKVCSGISAPWGGTQSQKKAPGALALWPSHRVTLGCSRQREEHMQMPASVSEHGVSQEWQTEHVGQEERLKRLQRP